MQHSRYTLLLIVMLALVIDGCAMVRPRGNWEPSSRDRVFGLPTPEIVE